MAIVCQTSEGAQELRDHADDVHNAIQNRSQLPTDTSKSSNEEIDGYREVVGLVTLENVIERILLIDIHDEKDREAAHKLL
jgi:hypothetical protein